MSTLMLEKAEKRIAQLEAERDKLRAELDELKAWRERVREAVGPSYCGWCDLDDCGPDE